MTNEEYTPSTPEAQPNRPSPETRAYEVFQDTVDHFIETADQRRVIGDAIQHGDQLIIPTAEVFAAMGFGVGGGGPARTESEPRGGSGTGGAGGGNTFSRPVAVIVADANGVQVLPVVDRTKILLTALTAFGFLISTIASFRRGPRH